MVGGSYGHEVDIFSWAVIAYELFAKCTVAACHCLDEKDKIDRYIAKVSKQRFRNDLPRSWPQQLRQVIRDC